MSYFTKPQANLINCHMIREAIQEKLDDGFKLYHITATEPDGSNVWFQIISKRDFYENIGELHAMACSLYFDRYHTHSDGNFAIVNDEIGIDECNTANLYEI